MSVYPRNHLGGPHINDCGDSNKAPPHVKPDAVTSSVGEGRLLFSAVKRGKHGAMMHVVFHRIQAGSQIGVIPWSRSRHTFRRPPPFSHREPPPPSDQAPIEDDKTGGWKAQKCYAVIQVESPRSPWMDQNHPRGGADRIGPIEKCEVQVGDCPG